MSNYQLHIGLKYRRQGRIYSIEQALPNDQLGIKDILSGESLAITRGELLIGLFDGKLELIGDLNQNDAIGDRHADLCVIDLNLHAEDDPLRLEVIRRSHYVNRVMGGPPVRWNKEDLEPIIRAVSEEIGDKKPPSWVTLYRWLRYYESADRDVRALAPAIKARGNRRRKVTGKPLKEFSDKDYERARTVDDMIDQVIRTRYLSTNRPTVASIYRNLESRIKDDNDLRSDNDKLPTPHKNSLYQRVKTLDPYEVDCARHGRKYANAKYRANQQGPRPAYPLERVESDHTRLDLMVVDTETRLPLGRPWLTAILDIYTRMVLGIYLSFNPPSYLSVMQCLRHAIRPKVYVRKHYPEIKNDWPAYGLPKLLVVDNGKEFRSRYFEDACLQLGVRYQYAPPYCPWYKGTMERWFGTQNTRLLHELPGATFSNIFDRGDYDPQKHAVISLKALLELVHTWIIDIYHQDVHQGAQDIPYRRWTEAITEWPPNLPARADELDALTGCLAKRIIGKSGIQIFTLQYNCPELALIRHELEKIEKGEMAQIKYDPNDLSKIQVFNPKTKRFIEVPALNQEYASELTLHQHKIIQKYARRSVNERLDVEALCRARKRVEEIVAQERVTQRTLTGRQKAARFLNLGQPDYTEKKKKKDGQDPAVVSQALEDNPIQAPSQIYTESLAPEEEVILDEAGWSATYTMPRRRVSDG
jgi:putative transposase